MAKVQHGAPGRRGRPGSHRQTCQSGSGRGEEHSEPPQARTKGKCLFGAQGTVAGSYPEGGDRVSSVFPHSASPSRPIFRSPEGYSTQLCFLATKEAPWDIPEPWAPCLTVRVY